MQKVYRCLASDFPQLQQRIRRIGRKLDKYGKRWSFAVIETKPEKIKIIDYSGRRSVPSDQFRPKILTAIEDVTSYVFEMEPLKLGNHRVIAVVEHGVTDDGSNMIHVIDQSATIPTHYRTGNGVCDHCGINRFRVKTVLLQDEQGRIKQVGKSCLHEYTGIECEDIITIYADCSVLFVDEPAISLSFEGYEHFIGNRKYCKTVDYLAACIHRIKREGYKKGETKSRAWDDMEYDEYLQHMDEARQIIGYFANKQIDEKDHFLYNIKTALHTDYTKESGIIAYAYIAYQKEKEKDIQRQADAISQHVGKIGDKLTLHVIFKDMFDYQTQFGTTFIYLFSDEKGNIFKWKTSKAINEWHIGQNLTIKGTIKEHSEYKGVLQTELTRCKVVDNTILHMKDGQNEKN